MGLSCALWDAVCFDLVMLSDVVAADNNGQILLVLHSHSLVRRFLEVNTDPIPSRQVSFQTFLPCKLQCLQCRASPCSGGLPSSAGVRGDAGNWFGLQLRPVLDDCPSPIQDSWGLFFTSCHV